MSGWQTRRDRGFQGVFRALLIVIALLLPASAFAAAPPVGAGDIPGPGPLFNPDDFHTNPVHMAVAVFGSPPLPCIGPLATAATLVAGEHTKAWNLEGVMTNRYSRWSLGAATLVGGGFDTGASPLAQVARLKYGQTLDCWALMNTDRFRPLPVDWLRIIRDGRRVAEGGVESDIYAQVIARAFYTSQAAFKKAVHTELTYTHLIDEAISHRGKAVRVEGRLMKINRFNPPAEAASAGVNDLYEAWVFTDRFSASPHCVVFTNWPEGLSRSLLGQPKITDIVRVEADGYFFKSFKYRAVDRKGTERDAPLLVAHSLIFLPVANNAEDTTRSWFQNLKYAFIGMLGVLVIAILGVTYWFRRNDNSTRRRLMAQAPEFALPPPDAPPPTPYAPIARPVNGVDRAVSMPARITFPASGKGDGERGEGPAKEDKPPDEGAGA